MRSCLLALLVYVVASLAGVPASHASTKVNIGVLKYGTVSWVLETIRANGLDKAEGIELDVTPLASPQATARLPIDKNFELRTTSVALDRHQKTALGEFATPDDHVAPGKHRASLNIDPVLRPLTALDTVQHFSTRTAEATVDNALRVRRRRIEFARQAARQ